MQDVIDDVYDLYVRMETEPERKGDIALAWLKDLPAEHRVLGVAIYGIAKERSVTQTNINISGQVGNFNLGQQYGAVTSTLTSLASAGEAKKSVADSLQALADGVNASPSISEADKVDLLEGINALGEQAKEAKPKKFTVSALLKSLPDALKATADLGDLWSAHGQTVVDFFRPMFT